MQRSDSATSQAPGNNLPAPPTVKADHSTTTSLAKLKSQVETHVKKLLDAHLTVAMTKSATPGLVSLDAKSHIDPPVADRDNSALENTIVIDIDSSLTSPGVSSSSVESTPLAIVRDETMVSESGQNSGSSHPVPQSSMQPQLQALSRVPAPGLFPRVVYQSSDSSGLRDSMAIHTLTQKSHPSACSPQMLPLNWNLHSPHTYTNSAPEASQPTEKIDQNNNNTLPPPGYASVYGCTYPQITRPQTHLPSFPHIPVSHGEWYSSYDGALRASTTPTPTPGPTSRQQQGQHASGRYGQ